MAAADYYKLNDYFYSLRTNEEAKTVLEFFEALVPGAADDADGTFSAEAEATMTEEERMQQEEYVEAEDEKEEL